MKSGRVWQSRGGEGLTFWMVVVVVMMMVVRARRWLKERPSRRL